MANRTYKWHAQHKPVVSMSFTDAPLTITVRLCVLVQSYIRKICFDDICKQHINKCVSKTDTNPPFAFQIAFPRGTDFTGFLQGGSNSRDLQSEISVRIESVIESADIRLQLQC